MHEPITAWGVKPPHRTAAYAVALVCFAAAGAIRALLQPLLGNTVPYITFYPAVMVASWYGGLGPGLLVTALAGLTAQFFLLAPINSFHISSFGDGLSLVLFIANACVISALNEFRHRASTAAANQARLADERLRLLEHEAAQRRNAEARMAEAKGRAANTLASIGDAVICVDVDGQITFINPVAEVLTGWPLSEAKGRPLNEVFVILNEESRKPAPNPVRRVLQEGRILGLANHTVLIARDGSEIPIDDSGAPIRDDQKQIIGAVLVFRDITQRKLLEDELRSTADRLQISNSDLEEYARAISHDLQEPLRGMRAFSELLLRRYEGKLDSDADSQLRYIVSGAARMSSMIGDLLRFSRMASSAGDMSPVRVSDAVHWALENLQGAIQGNHAEVDCGALPTVTADHIQLVQLFQNLIGNALKYRSAHTPHIRLQAREIENHWHISVSDNGIGIPEAYHEQIFRVFSRVSDDKPGTGIGLAICKRIVQRHGGEIWVESQPGQGTTFHFTLSKSMPGKRKEQPSFATPRERNHDESA